VKYHPGSCGALTTVRTPHIGPWQVGSLTGAVASERVTEAREGSLSADDIRALECNGIREPDGETDGSSRHESGP
jgi:hypothetical protein